MARVPNMDRPWRVKATEADGFDEVVVSDWLHVERMSDTHFWMSVGGRSFDVFRRNGRIEVVEQ